ncbi:body wall muscle protein HR-29-like [Styela clava]|uniref:body wall muscle protein HR-29-like n=1 Tax=Styela clava TaxID=7725 RepID=UPI00193A747A|nr:body wall muscle protein HR-29-like [Styela clava]
MSLRPLFESFVRPVHRMRLYPSHFHNFWEPFTWPTVRRTQSEDEFDKFVRQVDDRFTGMFAHVDDASSVTVEREGQEVNGNPNKYEMKISVQDFEPEDLKVKVQGNDLIVEARKEEKKEEGGMLAHSFRQFRRTFTLPEGVDKKNLTSALSRGGILEIEAPRVAPVQVEKQEEKKKIDVTFSEP